VPPSWLRKSVSASAEVVLRAVKRAPTTSRLLVRGSWPIFPNTAARDTCCTSVRRTSWAGSTSLISMLGQDCLVPPWIASLAPAIHFDSRPGRNECLPAIFPRPARLTRPSARTRSRSYSALLGNEGVALEVPHRLYSRQAITKYPGFLEVVGDVVVGCADNAPIG
jgi:hypothetical protein